MTGNRATIGDQLDAAYPPNPSTDVASWREYAEDMGNDATRDGGTADPPGGTDCAHPTVGGTDHSATAEATDQYTTRHNPFMYFHSTIDNAAECDANVVPLGTVAVGTRSTFNGTNLPDTFTGHLASDLSSEATTPSSDSSPRTSATTDTTERAPAPTWRAARAVGSRRPISGSSTTCR